MTSISTKKLLYYADLICQKIDLQTSAAVKRIYAITKGDMEKTEFLEKMMIEPLSLQISYLAEKAINIEKDENKYEYKRNR